MSKYKSDVDHLEYRVDLIERRLEKIEDLMMSSSNKNNNQEIISLLLNMVKQQYTPVVANATTIPAKEVAAKEVAAKEDECANQKTDSFNLRRLSMVL